MAKRALLVGCNYTGTSAQLSGCVGDVAVWKSLLEEVYGFQPEDMVVMIDTDSSYTEPTGQNIKETLKRMVGESQEGDLLWFSFSGHGVQIPDEDGEENDGMDEALCPCDFNLLVDDDLRVILSDLDPGCKFTMVSDCCHSGGMLDHEEVVISGDSADEVAGTAEPHKARELFLEDIVAEEGDASELTVKNRAIDVKDMAQILKERAGDDDTLEVDEMKPRSTLLKLFGFNASNAAKLHTADMPADTKSTYTGAGKKPAEDLLNDPNKGILITGCQASETSADVTSKEGKSFGALTHTINRIVRRHHRKNPDQPITYRQLVLKVRHVLKSSGFTQNPCLECSENNADAPFVLA